MRTLSLRGVRGGVGVSSLVAGMGHALHSLGERVLIVDLCPENMLRLYFNLATHERFGWARAMLDGATWSSQAWSVTPNLSLLPYGSLDAREQEWLEHHLVAHPGLWAERLANLSGHYDWVLFDMPQRLAGHSQIGPCHFPIQVVEADAACHVLLQQQAAEAGPLLVNRFDPGSQLQRDVMLVWRKHYADRMLSLTVHNDEAMRESLAFKTPVGLYAPGSLVAQDVLSLATWCLARRQEVA